MSTFEQNTLKGTSLSSGVAQGTAYVLTCSKGAAALLRQLNPDDVGAEVARFEAAVVRAVAELTAIKADVASRVGPGEADIFTAQALVLRDHSFHGQVKEIIQTRRINAEAAVGEVVDHFTRRFDEIPDVYLRERAADIRDVGRRVLEALIEERPPELLDIPPGSIVIADELLPSVTARLDVARVKGFVTERGSKFSHTAILARSMRTPAVTSIEAAARTFQTGDPVIVDGHSGIVFRNPTKAVQKEYDRVLAELSGYRQELQQLIDVPAVTTDGQVIALQANVSKLSDAESAFLYNADGIGLYRTEFSFSVRTELPSEDQQVEFWKRAAARFHPRKVAFRLLDLGGDKQLPYLPLPPSRNPWLSERGVRVLLRHPQVLRSQLRALLRISADHPISILLPVVNGIEEVKEIRAALQACQRELDDEGVPHNRAIELGAMIEVPSAALMIPALARVVDFFSLGTNDLVQYVLAADREDPTVSAYYQPLHPGVLHLIHLVATQAVIAGKPLTICGEMAGDPTYTKLLVGLGLRQFSVAPGELLDIKHEIRRLSLADAEALGREALALPSVAEIEAHVERRR